MKEYKKIVLLVCLLLLVQLCGCNIVGSKEPVDQRTFVDSAGRKVDIPVEIKSVIPSGAYAQVMLYTLCPEKLTGLSVPFTKIQKRFIDEEYWNLPVVGQFYGGSGRVNEEEIISAAPDIIIDIGEAKPNIVEDMDGMQERTGIPVVFIAAPMDSIADAYDMLGEILGVPERGQELSAYVRDVLALAEKNRGSLAETEKVSAIYSQGEYGLEVNGAGSIHAEVLDVVGLINAAELAVIASKGGDEVSIEQMMLWNPEVLLLSPDANYDEIFEDPLWAEVEAVKKKRVYEVPIGPYSWLDRPPSVQRILGVLWLGNLLYPELYDYDITSRIQEFYHLFFRYELTEQEAKELMKNGYAHADE